MSVNHILFLACIFIAQDLLGMDNQSYFSVPPEFVVGKPLLLEKRNIALVGLAKRLADAGYFEAITLEHFRVYGWFKDPNCVGNVNKFFVGIYDKEEVVSFWRINCQTYDLSTKDWLPRGLFFWNNGTVSTKPDGLTYRKGHEWGESQITSLWKTQDGAVYQDGQFKYPSQKIANIIRNCCEKTLKKNQDQRSSS
jgi:hypothetical protein